MDQNRWLVYSICFIKLMRVFLPDFICNPHKNQREKNRKCLLKGVKRQQYSSVRNTRIKWDQLDDRKNPEGEQTIFEKTLGLSLKTTQSNLLSELYQGRKYLNSYKKIDYLAYKAKNKQNQKIRTQFHKKEPTKKQVKSQALINFSNRDKIANKHFLITKKYSQMSDVNHTRPKTFELHRKTAIRKNAPQSSGSSREKETLLHSRALKNQFTEKKSREIGHKTLDIELVKGDYRPWSPTKIEFFEDYQI